MGLWGGRAGRDRGRRLFVAVTAHARRRAGGSVDASGAVDACEQLFTLRDAQQLEILLETRGGGEREGWGRSGGGWLELSENSPQLIENCFLGFVFNVNKTTLGVGVPPLGLRCRCEGLGVTCGDIPGRRRPCCRVRRQHRAECRRPWTPPP